MSIINESEIDEIIKYDGLNNVLKYILESYSSKIDYNTICNSLDYVDLLRELKQKKPYEQDFNNEVLGLFDNKELAEYSGISIIDEFKSKDVLKYMDLSFDDYKTLKEFEIEVIKIYLADYAYYNYTNKKCEDSNFNVYYDKNNFVIDEFYEIHSLLTEYVGIENIPKIISLDKILDIYFNNNVIENRGHDYNIENHFIFINDVIKKINTVLIKQNYITNTFCLNHDYYTSYYYIEYLQNLDSLKNNIIDSIYYNDLIIENYIEIYGKVYSNILLDQIENLDGKYYTTGIFNESIVEFSDQRVLDFECKKDFKDNLLKDIEDFFDKSIDTFEGGLMSELNDLKEIIME